MNQTSFGPYLVIGAGRVATHIKHYFGLRGLSFLEWNRKAHTVPELAPLLAKASVVLLPIKDSAIEEFRDRHLKDFKGTIAHFSGALHVDGIESFHPLMTFGPQLYDLDFYEKISIAASSKDAFRTCFPELKNPVFALRTEDKPFYHALCVMSGNFPQILWKECLASFDALGVPSEAVGLYLQKNLENFRADPAQSLTGPLVRGDETTIQKNMKALPERLRELYRAFVTFYRG